MSNMNQQFRYLLRVRYAECDAQKVVFNAKYVEYMDIAVTEFFRVLWGNYTDTLDKGMDMQVVNVNVDWMAPALFDQVIAITVQNKRIGNTSFTLQLGFFNHQTKQQIAAGEITYVMVSAIEHQKIKVPENLRTKLETGASGMVVNHAGVEII